MAVHKPHISMRKRKELSTLRDLIKKYPVVGIIDIASLPSSQFQFMKHGLRGKLIVRVTKKRLLKILFKEASSEKVGIDKLEPYLDKGIPAVMFSMEEPFKVFNNFKRSQSSAPAKAGQIAPSDVYAKAGPTPFTPGPIISEFGALGIKTKVEGGKITILSDKLLVKEGGVIDGKTADFMSKLGLKPMKIGINMVACYDNGAVFDKEVLDVDYEELECKFMLAYSEALNLATYIGYVTSENISLLLTKNYREALAIAKASGVATSETLFEQVKEAAREVLALEGKIPNFPDDESEKKEGGPKVKVSKEEEILEEEPYEEPVEEMPAEEESLEEEPYEEPVGEMAVEDVIEEEPQPDTEPLPEITDEDIEKKQKELEKLEKQEEEKKSVEEKKRKFKEESTKAKEVLDLEVDKLLSAKNAKKEAKWYGLKSNVPSAHDLKKKKDK